MSQRRRLVCAGGFAVMFWGVSGALCWLLAWKSGEWVPSAVVFAVLGLTMGAAVASIVLWPQWAIRKTTHLPDDDKWETNRWMG